MTYMPTKAEFRKRWHGMADKLAREEAIRLCERTFNLSRLAQQAIAQQARKGALIELLCKGVTR